MENGVRKPFMDRAREGPWHGLIQHGAFPEDTYNVGGGRLTVRAAVIPAANRTKLMGGPEAAGGQSTPGAHVGRGGEELRFCG